MINRIYVTSEEVNLVKEILEKDKLEENVLETLIFCKYYNLEIKSDKSTLLNSLLNFAYPT